MLNLAFTPPKAELVMKLCDGAVAQTRRRIEWEPLEEGLNLSATSLTAAPYITDEPDKGWCLYSRDGRGTWNTRTRMQKPRYPVGAVCYVGCPHWRGVGTLGRVNIYDEYTTLIRCEQAALSVECRQSRETLIENGWCHMAGRYMSAWAATKWALITRVWVERLQAISEADAKAELVEWQDGGWRDYNQLTRTASFGCATARDSYRTLVNAVNHRDIWSENPFCFCYEFRICPKPEEKARD